MLKRDSIIENTKTGEKFHFIAYSNSGTRKNPRKIAVLCPLVLKKHRKAAFPTRGVSADMLHAMLESGEIVDRGWIFGAAWPIWAEFRAALDASTCPPPTHSPEHTVATFLATATDERQSAAITQIRRHRQRVERWRDKLSQQHVLPAQQPRQKACQQSLGMESLI